MKPRHQVSRSAIELIKRFEGYRRKAAQLPDGRWTIGYGHTLTAREGAEVSEEDAEALLIYDLIAVSHAVNEWVFTPLNQNQFDALVAFAFNIGTESFRGSAVLRRLNEGALIQAACAMELWRKAEFEGERIVVDALVRRRSAEKALFLTPLNGWVPAPSPVVRPKVDLDVSGLVPRQVPTALTAPLDGDKATLERDEARQEHPSSQEADSVSPPAQAAAAVSSRLSGIFQETAPGIPPEPARIVIEDEEEEGAADLPPATANAAFALTPPEDDPAPEEVAREAKLELVAANESEPTLFETDAATTSAAAQEASSDDLFTDRLVPRASKRKRKAGLAPAIGLAVAGLAIFGGSLFWAMNTPASQASAGPDRGVVVWLAGIVGVALIGVAVYLILDRLGRPILEPVEPRLDREE